MRRKTYRDEQRRLRKRIADATRQRDRYDSYLKDFSAAEGTGSAWLDAAKQEAREYRSQAVIARDKTEEALKRLRRTYWGARRQQLGRFARRAFPVAMTLSTAVLAGTLAYQRAHPRLPQPRIVEKVVRYETLPIADRDVPDGVKEQLRAAGLGTGRLYVIDSRTEQAVLYRLRLEEVKRVEVSTGSRPGDKRRSGDHRTPETRPGEFYHVMSVERSKEWRDPFAGEKGAYGPYFLRFDSKGRRLARWGNGRSPFGLHGTNHPEEIGTPASHGCIRHLDRDITDLVKHYHLGVGDAVAIREGILSRQPNGGDGGDHGAR